MQVVAPAAACLALPRGRPRRPCRRRRGSGAARASPAAEARRAVRPRPRAAAAPPRCWRWAARSTPCSGDLHHIVADGWSVGVLVREVAALYAGLRRRAGPRRCRRCRSSTPTTPLWQRRRLAGRGARRPSSATGGRALAGAPVLELPDRPAAAGAARLARRAPGAVRPAGAARGAACWPSAPARGATPFMTLLAGFAALLAPLQRRRTTCRSARRSPPHPRRGRGPDRLLRQHPGAAPRPPAADAGAGGFRELLDRVRGVGARRLRPPGAAVREAGRGAAPERDPARTPLFQVLFSLQNAPRRRRLRAAGPGAQRRLGRPAAPPSSTSR